MLKLLRMNNIIANDQELRRYIPNVINSVKGEPSLYEKLEAYLNDAQSWAINNIIGLTTFDVILERQDNNGVKNIAKKVIAVKAFIDAIPALDLILTPNGFGVVSNQNVAPASKERVKSLTEAMQKALDDALFCLIDELRNYPSWLSGERAQFFAASLFHNLEVCSLADVQGPKWETFCKLRLQAIDIENSLAEDYISPELMDALRWDSMDDSISAKRGIIINALKIQVLNVIKGESISSRKMCDCVQIIRSNPTIFPEWIGSETAKRFSPPVFKNDKKKGGYFF